MDECNKMNAKNVTCANEQDICLKKTMSKDGKESGLYGCASYQECMTVTEYCKVVKKNNASAECMSECCNTTSCNTPPEKKSMMPLFVLTFKLNFVVVNPTIGSSPV